MYERQRHHADRTTDHQTLDAFFSAPMARAVLDMMSASITRITVRKQLAAMACERFEIGILQQSGRTLIRTVSSPKH